MTNFTPRSFILVFSGLLALALTAHAQNPASPVTIPVPKVMGPVPVTPDSHPFSTARLAQAPIDLAALGYVEEEFFISGTGNTYDWEADGSIKIRQSGLPYTTRILVRRPANPDRFSGTVLVDIANQAAGFDTFALWGQLNSHLLANGHAYVALTAFGRNIGALRMFDKTRYAALSYPKPVEKCGPATPQREIWNRPAEFFPETENGIRWDVISQVAALLKANSPVMAGLQVEYVYAAMQSGGDLPTYVNAIARNVRLENGKSVYDGFLIKDSGTPGVLNTCSPLPANDPRRTIRNAGVPVIHIVAQGDVTAAGRRADSDATGDQFRRYELPGASHFDAWHYKYFPEAKELAAAGIPPLGAHWTFPHECEPHAEMNDFPQPYIFGGAFANLDQWVRKGTAPPHATFIEIKDGRAGTNAITDEFGNARGGVRTPWVDVPVASFSPVRTGIGGTPFSCDDIGYWVPFSWTRLESLYGSTAKYSKKFLEAVDRLVKERWVTPADGETIKRDFQADEGKQGKGSSLLVK